MKGTSVSIPAPKLAVTSSSRMMTGINKSQTQSHPQPSLVQPKGSPVLVPSAAAAPGVAAVVDPSGLVAPEGCMYASSISQTPISLQIPEWLVTFGGSVVPDDYKLQSQTQTSNSQTSTGFYVYWVNGGTSPYFVLILSQTGSMSPGVIAGGNGDPNADGYFQYRFSVGTNPIQMNGSPVTTGLTLLSHSPTGTSNDGVATGVSVPMSLIGDTTGGTGPVQFTASVNDSMSFADWQMTDNVGNNGSNTTQWTFQQYAPWGATDIDNFVTNFPNCFEIDNGQGSGDVIVPSAAAFGSVAYEVYTVWTFGPSFFTMPATPLTMAPSLPITVEAVWEQSFADIHNPTGCLTAASMGFGGIMNYHCVTHSFTTTATWSIDLGQLVNPPS